MDMNLPNSGYEWAAGFFEGEGCFTCQAQKNRIRLSSRISNTDIEILTKFHSIIEIGNINGPYNRGLKPIWLWQASGEKNVGLVASKLWPWLGTRRRERVVELFGGNFEPYEYA